MHSPWRVTTGHPGERRKTFLKEKGGVTNSPLVIRRSLFINLTCFLSGSWAPFSSSNVILTFTRVHQRRFVDSKLQGGSNGLPLAGAASERRGKEQFFLSRFKSSQTYLGAASTLPPVSAIGCLQHALGGLWEGDRMSPFDLDASEDALCSRCLAGIPHRRAKLLLQLFVNVTLSPL